LGKDRKGDVVKMWGRKGEGGLREEIKRLKEENDRKTAQLRAVVEENKKLGKIHPATGVDKELLAKNAALKNENKRLWETVERALSVTNRLEGIVLDLHHALYWKIPSRDERKVIIVKKKEEIKK
jgi:hypothetical protein